MDRLPIELLHHIFLLCLPSDPYTLPRAHDAPLLLAQVSQRWRSAALDCRELWASIQLVVPPANVTGAGFDAHTNPNAHAYALQRRLASYETWLERARGAPLHVSIVGHHPVPSQLVDAALVRALERLHAHASSWRDIHLRLAHRLARCAFSPSAASTTTIHAPLLRRLSVAVDLNPRAGLDGDADDLPQPLHVVAPDLRTLDLRSGPWISSQLHFSSAVLSDLTLRTLHWPNHGSLSVHDLLRILIDAPNLRSLDVALLRRDEQQENRPPTQPAACGAGPHTAVVLPFLHCATLWTDYLDNADVTHLFDSLHAPTLHELRLSDGSSRDVYPSAFASFLTRSPLLRILDVCEIALDESDLVRAFQHTPLLHTLCLDADLDQCGSDLLHALTVARRLAGSPLPPPSTHLLPALATLVWAFTAPIEPHKLLRFLVSRWQPPYGVARLDRATVRVDAERGEKPYDQLLSLRDKGMQLKVCFRDEDDQEWRGGAAWEDD